jgi:hypothetical protein
MNNSWFSTKLRFAVIIETKGLVRYSDSIYLFHSTDFKDAFQRALEIGHCKEQCYINGDGQQVVWKFAEVISLDIIQSDSMEGTEIHSEPVSASDPLLTIKHEFHPELSEPTQTI